jgi:PST family polysaccharide transporter
MNPEPPPLHSKLDAEFVGGLAWTAGAKGVTQAVTWLAVLVAAHLLTPADFGTVQIAAFVGTLTNLLAEFGIGIAVLHMIQLDRRVLAQLNTISLVFCSLAFVASVAIAPLVASFFRSEQLRMLVIINSLAFFITAVSAVPLGLLQRDMDYRRLSFAESISVIVQAVVTIGAAFAGLGYWSLVAGPFAGKATGAVLAAVWKPVGFAIPRWSEIRVHMRFGMEVALSRIASTAYSQADGMIIGRMLGDSALGAYQMAMTAASAPAEKIGQLIMRVAGPLFARIQEDRTLVRRYFLFITDALALSIFPLVFGLAAVAPEMVQGVLGAKWIDAVRPLQWLAIFTALRTMNGLMTQVLTSLRFTTYSLWISILSFVVMPLSFFLAAHWGATAVAATWTLTAPLLMFPPALKLFREIKCSVWDYVRILAPALVASTAMVAGVLALKTWIVPGAWLPVWKLAVEVAAGGVVYCGILYVFYRPLLTRYLQFFLRLRKDRSEAVVVDV